MAPSSYRKVSLPQTDDGDARDVAKEIRTARRSAAVALGVSMLAFGTMLVIVLRKPASPAGPVPMPPAAVGAQVGLSEMEAPVAAPLSEQNLEAARSELTVMRDVVDNIADGQALVPSPYRLTAERVLYQMPSVTSGKAMFLEKGQLVRPMKAQANWVEVVVPKGRGDASFGWINTEGGLDALLKPDPTVKRPKRTGPPATQEEIRAKWEKVRTNNEKLKARLAQLQTGMANAYNQELKRQKEAMGQQALQKAQGIANLKEVQKDLKKAGDALKQELKMTQPKDILSDVAKAFQ